MKKREKCVGNSRSDSIDSIDVNDSGDGTLSNVQYREKLVFQALRPSSYLILLVYIWLNRMYSQFIYV